MKNEIFDMVVVKSDKHSSNPLETSVNNPLHVV